MEIEVLDYFRRLQEGEFNLLHAGLIYLAGLGSVWLASTILATRAPLERAGVLTLAAVAPLVGLVLTSVVYTCASCTAPPQCDIVRVGVPFPQEIRERDPSPAFGACWWSLTESSRAAVFGNFALGTLGLPLLVTFFRPVRVREDEIPGSSKAGPQPGPGPYSSVMEPMIELILSPADPPGLCTVCERKKSGVRCDSCEPSHYLCRDCLRAHRDDFNALRG